MLSLAILIPFFAAPLVLLTGPRLARLAAISLSAVSLALLCAVWVTRTGPGFGPTEVWPWIPALDIAWRVGVDGISLSLALLTALVFTVSAAWPVAGATRGYYGWMLFLAGVSIGLFLALDMVLFYVFFDLSLVGMYFLIGRWGHGDAQAAALKFFIYTLVGSLAILLGILVMALSMPEPSFDMRKAIAAQSLTGPVAGWIVFAFLLGFAVKTPLFPVHTWLPPAHVDAPGPASAILAGILLKMGTYGMIRFPFQMMRETFAAAAPWLAAVAVVSILWGALVAFSQANLKRRIAHTSVNHMGYAVLGIAAAGSAAGSPLMREVALTGAVLEMVAHGLITGALFLMAGGFWQRRQDYALDRYGGLAAPAPRFAGAMVLASFASFGLPGLAGFVAELQIFMGAFATFPMLAAVGLLGLVVTAALFLTMLRQLFFGERPENDPAFPDLAPSEMAVLSVLLGLVVLIGVWPAWLIDLIGAAATIGG